MKSTREDRPHGTADGEDRENVKTTSEPKDLGPPRADLGRGEGLFALKHSLSSKHCFQDNE